MEFNYVAKTKAGEAQTGLIEAVDERSAIETLQARGLVILNLNKTSSVPLFLKDFKMFQRVAPKELVSFSRQLSTLVSAQVPLLSSLQSLGRQTENKYFKEIVLEIANDVENGTIFSRALANYPKVFSNFFVSMVKSGEASGNLENTLGFLADYLEKQYYLMRKVVSSLSYPAFILVSFTLIAALLMVLVVPQLTSFLKESGQELPLMTNLIIGLSNFLRSWWWLLLLITLGGSYYLYYSVKHFDSARRRWDLFKISLPVFGKKVFYKIYIGRIAENISTLIQGGLSILQALQITSEVVGNKIFEEIILEAKEDVRVGNSLSSSFIKHKEMPAMVVQMIATGEQTGTLDIILKKMAQFYSKEIDATVDSISQLIEPILLVVIGIGVAVLVVAILMPIYNIANVM
jgi:type IV pilus assembly protein PilC